jgi:stage V sporulation protein G
MEITEVRVKLVANQDDRLKAFCSMTLDNEFVIRDVKIIEGTGGLFVAMPSRKMSDHCGKCGGKNHLRAKFCTNCGAKLPENRVKPDAHGHLKLHADIAHPINASADISQPLPITPATCLSLLERSREARFGIYLGHPFDESA